MNGAGGAPAVDEAVARHRAIRQLLALEEEERRRARGRQIAVGDQSRPRLVEVTREHLAVRAEVRVRGVAGGDGLSPRGGEAGADRAREPLGPGRLWHVRLWVTLVLAVV